MYKVIEQQPSQKVFIKIKLMWDYLCKKKVTIQPLAP